MPLQFKQDGPIYVVRDDSDIVVGTFVPNIKRDAYFVLYTEAELEQEYDSGYSDAEQALSEEE